MDDIFTVVFAIELCINVFAHWFKLFISEGWNIFDVVVVTISLIALGPFKIPVNVIRSLRAFRLIRIFRRFKGLKNIVSGLASSVSPVLQALLVLFIAMAICALRPHFDFSSRIFCSERASPPTYSYCSYLSYLVGSFFSSPSFYVNHLHHTEHSHPTPHTRAC